MQLQAETQIEIPENVQEVIDWYQSQYGDDISYVELEQMLVDVEGCGWTFDYGLSGEPMNLREKH